MRRRFVDAIWIRARMDRTDLRFQAAARRRATTVPAFLRPEAVGYASVEIIPAPVDVPAELPGPSSLAFHRFLADPSTGPRLDAMLADNARIDAQLREDDRLEDLREGQGDGGCSSACGWCNRCS
jgi:hypothetical protein